jgi:hypothetical protein
MTIANQTSQGLAGVDIFNSSTEQKHALGTRIRATYGSAKDKSAELVYIKVLGGTVVEGNVHRLPLIAGSIAYVLDLAVSLSTALTKTNAASIATAQNMSFSVMVMASNISAGEYGWAFVRGTIPINTAASCAANVPLGLTATAGRVDDADKDYELLNTTIITAVGGAAAVSDCHASMDLRVFRNLA